MPLIQTCRFSHMQFEVSDADLAFCNTYGPVIGGRTFPLPPPQLSPEERLMRRLAFRQERSLYRRTCAVTGKQIVSIYSPDKQLKVVDKTAWLELDNREFGRDFDFSRPFFEQFAELYRDTYKACLSQSGENQNTEYAHFIGRLKNGYLCFDSGDGEDLVYSVFIGRSKCVYDSFLGVSSEIIYECVKFEGCYECFYCTRVKGCSFCAFLYDCIGCKNCLGCTNLRNKEYYVWNTYVGKERFNEIWRSVFSGSYQAMQSCKEQFAAFKLTQLHRASTIVDCGSVTGEDLTRCEEVYDSFHCNEVRNGRYLHDCFFGVENCYDISSWGEGMERCCELTGCGGLSGSVGLTDCFFSAYLYYGAYSILYSYHCYEKSQDLFGCSDLRKARYCILNKQYTPEAYAELVPKIIEHMQRTGEWGEFFPYHLSPFGYNETVAYEEFPLTPKQAEARGAQWFNDAPSPQAISGAIPARDLPDLLPSVSDPACDSVVLCEQSGKPFKYVKSELEFYRTHGLPLPRSSFLTRHRARRARLAPRRLWPRTCSVTGEALLTSYPPDAPEIIVAEGEFLKRFA
jgi:hypothetical protein